MDRISQALTQRVKELAERYETPMPQQASSVPTGTSEPPPGKDGFLMEMKPGYKQTEVGVIPEDWDVIQTSRLLQQDHGRNAWTHLSRFDPGILLFDSYSC